MKKMAFVDLTDFVSWPMGGMLEYEKNILPYLSQKYDIDLWGVSVNGKNNGEVTIKGKTYKKYVWANVKTGTRIIPNYFRGLFLGLRKKKDFEDYDIVYAHTGSCIVALSRLIDKEKTKLIYHQHGLMYKVDFSLKTSIQKPFMTKAQKISDITFVVSDPSSVVKQMEYLKNEEENRLISIGSPVELDKFNETKIKEKIKENKDKHIQNFLYTGRLTHFKNVPVLVDAFLLYINNYDEKANLIIIGDGPEYNLIKNKLKELHIKDRVKLLGAVPHTQVYSILENCDAFVIPSKGEGVSVSVVEANAAGLPVACFAVPGLESQVIDNATGAISYEMSAESLYKAMVKIDKNRFLFSLNALKESKKYDSERISKKIYNNIEKLF
ncbi:glycosyltransferase family 4 protein [Liquorilactobacillus satsumensis]|uniref:glycosyltransferase family 4 protein n=1 Tax=Liquorilactobacillus TaxID=2767888 RepID=UPI001E29ED6B|nr:glycosyltransferase family 4 protein [Liquorilactobacillus satsumensis]MCC7667098.1 glycosyl transferase [Liquorilactobacillus satsumensis]MCP9358244.1 glycosyltransferase family 4 protein [Liquorilactobacillus satsumensis]MCP9372198.1 glycosyltransferase family 4 protein [Liquorilactobacillus satsumensis]